MTNNRMRANHYALSALNAQIGIPNRDFKRKIAFFPLSRAGGEGTINWESGNRNVVAIRVDDLTEHIANEFRRLIRDREPARRL